MATSMPNADTPATRAAKFLRALRYERGLSASAVEGLTEQGPYPMVTRSALAKIECGLKTLSVAELLALATALGVTPNDVLLQSLP